MFSFRLGFENPNYLWLLLGLPVLWFVGYESLAVLGRFRRWFALAFRTLVWSAIVVALAGVQMVWVSDRVTVMYLLDQSESIPEAKRRVMLDYVTRNVARHRKSEREDRAGIIIFGRDASIELPPFDEGIQIQRLESRLERTDATNLETAIGLAQASMPEDSSRRIVIVTDGNENLGQAKKLAARVADAGIGIDVVPVVLNASNEVLVEKLDLPTDIRKGQPFEPRLVINNITEDGAATVAKGKIRVKQMVNGVETLLADDAVTLKPGKNVFPFTHTINQPASYQFSAEFIPEGDADDGLSQNNLASAYTHVRGKGRVLMIEDRKRKGDHDLLINSLRDSNIEVDTRYSDQLFSNMAELQAFDCVILAGVPRISEDSGGKTITSFTDEHIKMLVRNTQKLGAGLLMIGGPEAFGSGGWTGTELEKAMPVDFEIKNTKIQAVGALALIMHASEMADGNHWQKVIAKAAIEQLGPADYAGVVHWTFNGDRWMWSGQNGKPGLAPVGPNRRAMLAAMSRMTPGDMPQFDPAMRMTVAGLARVNASVRHCIIISDGDPTLPAASTIKAFQKNNITISTVAVESHGLSDSRRLRTIAQQTKGKYYAVKSGRALPKIFQREARRVARPLIYEIEGGANPQVVFQHAMLDGIDVQLPPITGFVMTQTKDSPLAQVLIRSPKPDAPANSSVLAAWTYDQGRTAVLTTDTGARWASSWAEWPDYDKFFSQLVRWLMRPTGDTGKYALSTNFSDGEVQIVVNALSKEDAFANFLEMSATALDPELSPVALTMRQTAPGRYVGSFPATTAGSYFINVLPEPGAAPLSTGVTVPYSEEFRIRDTNQALIATLASTQPRDGEPGVVNVPLENQPSEELIDQNSFRGGLADAKSIKDAWPWFVLVGCCIFWADVFIRRVAVNFDFIGKAIAKISGRDNEKESNVTARLDALRKNKEALDDSIEKRRASVRFEPSQVDTAAAADVDLDNVSERKSAASKPAETKPEETGPSYTERLLEAKRKARKDK